MTGIILLARDLKTEPGDFNPEYDRALVELTSAVLGLTTDEYDVVADLIGVNR